MPRYEFRTPRLFVDAPLRAGGRFTLDAGQANYLRNVMRLKSGDGVLVFNGRDGEWQARLSEHGRRDAALAVGQQARPQTPANNLHYWFAPLKHARLDYMVQKAVEMGVSRLQPVLTRHTQVARVNLERMRANAIEAAEQCGILALPEIAEPSPLERLLGARDPARLLVFCDEAADVRDPVAALTAARAAPPPFPPPQAGEGEGMGAEAPPPFPPPQAGEGEGMGAEAPAPCPPPQKGENEGATALPVAVLIGPEGGFSDEERAALLRTPHAVRLALGPRILRADTAAVAALTLVASILGDWRG